MNKVAVILLIVVSVGASGFTGYKLAEQKFTKELNLQSKALIDITDQAETFFVDESELAAITSMAIYNCLRKNNLKKAESLAIDSIANYYYKIETSNILTERQREIRQRISNASLMHSDFKTLLEQRRPND